MRPRILFAVTAHRSIPLLARMPSDFVARGWEVHIAASPGPNLCEYSGLPSVHVHPLPMKRDPALGYDVVSFLRWVLLLARLRPSVAFIGTPKAGLLGMLGAFLLRVPVRVYLLRGLRVETEVGMRARILLWFEKAAATCSTSVFAISPSLRTKAIELSLCKSEKIEVVHRGSSHGVDLSRFVPRNDIENGRMPVVGFVGRVRTDKGVPELLDAVSRINQTQKVRLMLVGPLEDRSLLSQIGRARAGGLEILETGEVSAVEDFYSAMDVLCLPSHREGFGNVVIEAAACGVPAIVSDATGVRDTVLDGTTGFIVPTKDVEALTKTIRDAISDRSALKLLGIAARDYCVENFDDQVVNGAYEQRIRALAIGASVVS